MDYILQIFKALANGRRLKIVELLLERGEIPIENIARELKIPLATCCRNLKILERVYLVNSKRREGLVFYSLNKPETHVYNKLLIELIRFRQKRKFKE
jgi:DNA-binding transcriptional ArsR family regulator